MAIGVATGAGNRRLALVVDAQKAMGVSGGDDGVDGHLQVPVRAVLEPHRGGETRGHLPVGLGFGGAGADRCPAHQVTVILGRDRVQGLGARGQAEFADIQQEAARLLHPDVDAKGVVHEGIVDKALPACRRAGFLEIDPHHQHQDIRDLIRQGLEAAGVIEARHRIVNGAGADDQEAAGVPTIEDIHQGLASRHHHRRRRVRQGDAGLDLIGRGHVVKGGNIEILGLDQGHGQLPLRQGYG